MSDTSQSWRLRGFRQRLFICTLHVYCATAAPDPMVRFCTMARTRRRFLTARCVSLTWAASTTATRQTSHLHGPPTASLLTSRRSFTRLCWRPPRQLSPCSSLGSPGPTCTAWPVCPARVCAGRHLFFITYCALPAACVAFWCLTCGTKRQPIRHVYIVYFLMRTQETLHYMS